MLLHSEGINLDANASYGLLPELESELRALFRSYSNPSSIHSGGQRSRALIEEARERVGLLLGCGNTERIVFTSGATEANAMAVRGILLAEPHQQEAQFLTTAIEHPSVLEQRCLLERFNVRTMVIAPDDNGIVRADEFGNSCTPHTKLVSVMLANNETGGIQPVREIAQIVRACQRKVLVHCDAVQALGKIPFTFAELGVDMLSISAHKIGGLTGVGALVLRRHMEISPLLRGGPQESKLRAGTENVFGIISFGLAAKYIQEDLAKRCAAMRERKTMLETVLRTELSQSVFLHVKDSLPNTLSVRIPGVKADDLVVALDLRGIQISSGAACSSGKPDPSHVLLAMGLSREEARETIRLSLRAETPLPDLERAARTLVQCVRGMEK